jgi:hypothetical protein
MIKIQNKINQSCIIFKNAIKSSMCGSVN